MTKQERVHKLVSELRQAQVYIVYVSSPMQSDATIQAINHELSLLDGHGIVDTHGSLTVLHVKQLYGKLHTAIIEVHMTARTVVDLRGE
jgi:succinyl-CoA synthetase alpha subunit